MCFPLCLAVVWSLLLASTLVSTEWAIPAANLGGFGVLTWLIYYLFARVGPVTLSEFQATLREQREAAIAALDRQRADFLASLTEHRSAYERMTLTQQQHLTAMLEDEKRLRTQMMGIIANRHDVSEPLRVQT